MRAVVGQTGSFETLVAETDTAHALGNPGVHVLATPRLAGFCERAALDSGGSGGEPARRLRIDIRHLAPTPVGDRVEIVAELVDILGERLVFEVDGRDSRGRIVSGRVELLG